MIILNHPLFKLQVYVQTIMFELIVNDILSFLNDDHSLANLHCFPHIVSD